MDRIVCATGIFCVGWSVLHSSVVRHSLIYWSLYIIGVSAMYDVVLKGGIVVDCAQGWNGQMDIAFTGKKISKVAADIPSEQASKVLDVTDKVVAPGLIDVHAHMYLPKKNPAHPDSAGV